MWDRFLNTNEITKENFECRFQEIEKCLQDAHFVSIDVEFPGAPRKNSTWKLDGTNNLETPEAIYANFKADASNFIIIQFGITCFYFDSKSGKYEATCYTFYVFPQSPVWSQKAFQVHGAVVEMLTSVGFDFNKVVHQGISYMNKNDEHKFENLLYTSSTLDLTLRSLSIEDDQMMKEKCSLISNWESTAKVGDTMDLEDIDLSRKLIVFLLIQRIHNKFPMLWTLRIENYRDPSSPGVRIEKVSDLKRSDLMCLSAKHGDNKKDLIKHFVGISRIFKLLVNLKKPIIASGALFNFMMIYHQLYMPLPEKYSTFKRELHELFPYIYDIKHIAYELRELCRLKDDTFNEENGLEILDKYFLPGKGAELPSGRPVIRLSEHTNDAPATIGQDSGWDTYYSGCCFLRMAYFLAKENGCCTEIQPKTTLSEIISAGIEQHVNCLHIAPATVDFIRLNGLDPLPNRPRSLLLKPHIPLPNGTETVYDDLAQVARESIVIKMRPGGQAHITVNSHATALDIAGWCQERGVYTVKDEAKSVAVKQTFITGSVISFSAILLWKLYKVLQ